MDFFYAKQSFINTSKINMGIRDCSLKGGISTFWSSKNWNILKKNIFLIHLFSLVTSCYWTPYLTVSQTLPTKKSEKIYLIWKWIFFEWENPRIRLAWHEDYNSETSLNYHIHPSRFGLGFFWPECLEIESEKVSHSLSFLENCNSSSSFLTEERKIKAGRISLFNFNTKIHKMQLSVSLAEDFLQTKQWNLMHEYLNQKCWHIYLNTVKYTVFTAI